MHWTPFPFRVTAPSALAAGTAGFLTALAGLLPGQQFSPGAPLAGDTTVAAAAGNQHKPAIARGGNGTSLAVWEDDRSSLVDSVFGGELGGSNVPGNFDIYGVLLDALGQPLTTAPLRINSDTWGQRDPDVAWNGSEYLVVFSSVRPTATYFSRGIYAVRVTAGGTVLDPTPILVDDTPGIDESLPVVASNNGRWLVVWTDVGPTGYDVQRSAFVSATGVVGPISVLVSTPPGTPPTQVDLTATSSRFALTWSLGWSSNVFATILDANALPVAAPVLLDATGTSPAIGADGNGFYVAWKSAAQALRGTPLTATGVVAVPGGTALHPGPLNIPSLGVGHDGNVWLVATTSTPSLHTVRVAANGTPLGAAATVTTSPNALGDVVVGDGSGSNLLLWSDQRLANVPFGGGDPADVFGCVVDANGPGPVAAVSVSPRAQVRPRLAGDASHGFLVVYESLAAGQTFLQAMPIDGAGVATAPPFVVQAGDRRLSDADVAWNGSEFLVTWHEVQSNSPSGPPTLVFCRRCRRDGTLLDPAPVQVMEGANPKVAAVGGTFLISARFQHPILQYQAVRRCRRLDGATGQLLDAAPILLPGASANPVGVVGMQDRWLVLSGHLEGTFVLQNGTALPTFPVAQTGINSTFFRAAVNEAGDEAVVAYQWQTYVLSPELTDVRMRRIRIDGSSPDPLAGVVVSAANQAQLRPTVASLDDGYLLAWADHRDALTWEPGIGDVHTARVDSQGTVLDPTGVPLHDRATAEGDPVLLRSGLGRALHVAAVMLDGPFGCHRLVAGSYANAAAAPWVDLGQGLAGSAPAPDLIGHGPLLPQSGFTLRLTSPVGNQLCVLALGLSAVNAPLFGGVLVPDPTLLVAAVTTAAGQTTFAATWPAGFPGTSLLGQYWVLDATGPQGFTASNAVRGTSP